MIPTVFMVLGIVFVLNGISTMRNSKVVENVRAQMPADCEIFYGGSKGLLFLTSTDALVSVQKNGIINKAFCIKSGWLRKSKAENLHFDGYRMEKISDHIGELKGPEQKACSMALHQYMRRRKVKK